MSTRSTRAFLEDHHACRKADDTETGIVSNVPIETDGDTAAGGRC